MKVSKIESIIVAVNVAAAASTSQKEPSAMQLLAKQKEPGHEWKSGIFLCCNLWIIPYHLYIACTTRHFFESVASKAGGTCHSGYKMG